jgi:hypothetical protein
MRTVLEIPIMIPAAHHAILERLLFQPAIERPYILWSNPAFIKSPA